MHMYYYYHRKTPVIFFSANINWREIYTQIIGDYLFDDVHID